MIGEPNRLDEVVGGKYRIVRFLASGGMGSVYEAQQIVVRRRFAVKFLHPELALRRELLTRFQHEAEAAGALESENVAAALDFGIAPDGAPYIVLEYLVGESLEQLREREGSLPVARAVNLVQQACRGVQAAHAAGIIHRDLKPHNLFVCRRGDGTDLVKVLDFGVAKLEVMERGGVETRTGTVLGTPSYMSPEQARGEKKIDHSSDVYALGAVLYELLSGKKPHPGDSHNAILHHIATQPPLPLAAALPDLPEALVAVVERTLADDCSRRPASAGELAEALTQWSHAEVWPAPKLEPSSPRHSEPSTTLLAVEAPAGSRPRSSVAPDEPARLAAAPARSEAVSAEPRRERTPAGTEPRRDEHESSGAPAERALRPREAARSQPWVVVLAGALALAVAVIVVLARSDRGPNAPAAVQHEPVGPTPRAPTLKLVDVAATAQSVEAAAPAKSSGPSAIASAISPNSVRPNGHPAGRTPGHVHREPPAPESDFDNQGPIKIPTRDLYE